MAERMLAHQLEPEAPPTVWERQLWGETIQVREFRTNMAALHPQTDLFAAAGRWLDTIGGWPSGLNVCVDSDGDQDEWVLRVTAADARLEVPDVR